jgi:hypothetical protein
VTRNPSIGAHSEKALDTGLTQEEMIQRIKESKARKKLGALTYLAGNIVKSVANRRKRPGERHPFVR